MKKVISKPIFIKTIATVILNILIFGFLISCKDVSDETVYPSFSWPHEKNDLTPDPDVLYGRLKNGFRYVLMQNKVPKDRVSMHLNVQAGSIHESDDQKGIAHLLEHMLFKGTTHFAPGELIKYFQNIGMQFGPDANAYTGFYETVYDVLLPNGDSESLKKGLLILQDYAEGALLLPQEIDNERKVVLSEKRYRDSASYRTYVSALNFELPNTRIAKRFPIGSETVIRNADRKLLKDFYDTWYQPEKMILVIVGDFDQKQIIPIIEKKFSHLVSRAPPEKDPDMGQFDHKGVQAFYHFENEEGNTTVSIEVLRKIKSESDSKKMRIKRMKKSLADRMVKHRLNMMLRETDTPFTSASISSGVYLKEVKYAEISAQCSPNNWAETMMLIEQTLRKALVYGFMDEEFERVKKDYLSSLDNAVNKAATRNSKRLKSQIINSINSERVFLSPKQNRNLLAPVINHLSLQEVYSSFKESWDDDHQLILVTGNADLNKSDVAPSRQIINVYQKSLNTEVTKPVELKPVSFPYLPKPDQNGKIVNRIKHKDLGIIQIDYENGVRLNVMKTDFKDNEILAAIAFGYGRSDEPKVLSGISTLSQGVINESGLGALNKEELNRVLTGKRTKVNFKINERKFMIKGNTVPDEVELLFQLLYAYLIDPGYRKDAYALVMERHRQNYMSMSHSIEGAMRLHGNRFLAGGDSRFGLPSYNDFNKLTLDDVRTFTENVFKNAPLEISIVGDFDEEKILKMASKYMGSLPKRAGFGKRKRLESPTFPVSKRLDLNVKTEIPKGIILVAYPTEDIWNIQRTRRFSVLGDVLSDRLREQVREKLGATYSAYAYNRPSRVYSDYGILSIIVNVDPEASELIIKEVKNIVDGIIENGVSKEELKRALKPSITSIKDLMRKNDYWLNTVLNGSVEHPDQIEWSRSIMSDHTAITADELSDLSRKYLDNNKSAIVVIKSHHN
ncbi:MAG: insulinase family protein [Deltaproteobacteria bacterium]|nr:insulinase family protein [Deltaproteobacteria bacterium]